MNKIIISDTSCLIALSNIGHLEILQKLYSNVFVTQQVNDEFGSELPPWILIQKIKDTKTYSEICGELDSGEASSITLALENPGCTLIIDEKKGRQLAKEHHIQIIGTLKVILTAKEKGIIPSVKQIVEKLTQNNFRLEKKLVGELLKAAKEL
jgi:predicted nucleic acid-binding protein